MTKEFEMDYGEGTIKEKFDVDYMVLVGAYDNEHPTDHYRARKAARKVCETLEEAREKADGVFGAIIWEVAHDISSGDIVFVSEVK